MLQREKYPDIRHTNATNVVSNSEHVKTAMTMELQKRKVEFQRRDQVIKKLQANQKMEKKDITLTTFERLYREGDNEVQQRLLSQPSLQRESVWNLPVCAADEKTRLSQNLGVASGDPSLQDNKKLNTKWKARARLRQYILAVTESYYRASPVGRILNFDSTDSNFVPPFERHVKFPTWNKDNDSWDSDSHGSTSVKGAIAPTDAPAPAPLQSANTHPAPTHAPTSTPLKLLEKQMIKALNIEARLNPIANPAESRVIGVLDSDKGPSCHENRIGSREQLKPNQIEIVKVESKNQIADILTKGVTKDLFRSLKRMLLG